MTTNASATPHDGKGRQQLKVRAIEVALIDCGCWDNQHRFFGAMSGSVAVLAQVIDRYSQNGVCTVTPGAPSSSLSEANAKKLEALGPKLKLFLDTIKALGPDDRYGVEVFSEPVFAYALTEEEETAKGKATMLTGADELIIFLPDMHLGVLDGADDFAQKSSDPAKQLENLKLVEALIRKAKGLGATVYQMGDFLDIWEVEACMDKLPVYFGKAKPSVTLADRNGPNGTAWKVDRARRAREAEALVVTKWREAGGALFGYLYEGCDLQRLMGNHDIEAGSLDGALGTAPRAKEEGRHWYWDDGRRHCAWRMGRWAAEHGHYYDRFNDTYQSASPCKQVSEVIDKVVGKKITYHFARSERSERLPKFDEIIDDLNGQHTLRVQVSDPADTIGATVLNRNMLKGAFSISDDFVKNLLGPGVVTPKFDPWKGVRDGAGLLEMSDFDDMRLRLIATVANAVADWNKYTSWLADLSFPSTNRATRSFFVPPANSGAVYGTKPPLNLPFRVLFHGHTHQPMIVRLSFIPKAHDPPGGASPPAGT